MLGIQDWRRNLAEYGKIHVRESASSATHAVVVHRIHGPPTGSRPASNCELARQHALELPCPRGHRILPILGRHPPIEGKPQPAPAPLGGLAAEALRPRRQHITTPGRGESTRAIRSGHHGSPPLMPPPPRASRSWADAAATNAKKAEHER
jgi:hypothetical protein